MEGRLEARDEGRIRNQPGIIPAHPGGSEGGVCSLATLLSDLEFQDGQLGPSLNGVRGDSSTHTDPVLRCTKAMTPEGSTLGQGAAENRVLGDLRSLTFHHTALRHLVGLSSIHNTREPRTILVIKNSKIRTGSQVAGKTSYHGRADAHRQFTQTRAVAVST